MLIELFITNSRIVFFPFKYLIFITGKTCSIDWKLFWKHFLANELIFFCHNESFCFYLQNLWENIFVNLILILSSMPKAKQQSNHNRFAIHSSAYFLKSTMKYVIIVRDDFQKMLKQKSLLISSRSAISNDKKYSFEGFQNYITKTISNSIFWTLLFFILGLDSQNLAPGFTYIQLHKSTAYQTIASQNPHFSQ